MKPLSGLDATFLYAETPASPMSVIATVVVDGPVDFEALVARVGARLGSLHPFRRRLVEMPLGLDHPAWIEDADFDVREHVTRVTAPAPGDDRALEQVVGGLARRPLDRTRPLWEMTVVDGLANGRTALVTRAHHAAVDGVSGAATLLCLFDRPGDAEPAGTLAGWSPEPEPDAAALLRHGVARLRERPRAWRGALGRVGRSAFELARAHLGPDAPTRDAALPFRAPASPFNGPLSRGRSVSYARAPFASAQRIREAFGGTVNDVVLAACADALRGELLERGVYPQRPLLAAVPVSTRDARDPADCGNRISAFLAPLPVHLDDPIHRLGEVARATRRAKRLHSALGEHTLAALAELAPPALCRPALGLYARLGLAALHRPLVNLVVSNVPGPPAALSLLGRRVRALHPHGPLLEGVGLNLTVLSYAGSIDIGVLACSERVPEAHRLARGVADAIQRLDELAEAALPSHRHLVREVA